MRQNAPLTRPGPRTHEGAVAAQIRPIAALRRTVLTALLWEHTAYEDGGATAARMAALVPVCDPAAVAALAVEARDQMYLRHVPLFLVRLLARQAGRGTLVADTLARVIQRPDELSEYLALYWGAQAAGTTKRPEPLSAGSKRGLARAFRTFSAYQLAKYDRDTGVKLRDVLRLTHARPADAEQAAVWKQVTTRTLAVPDTWEVALSGGADKRATFERLLREERLGALAVLRNLRTMGEVGVDPALIRGRLQAPLEKVLPFRFLTAVRHAPRYAVDLDGAMLRAIAGHPRLPGRTVVLVDVSSSMHAVVSARSEVRRLDAAIGVAILAREIADVCQVFTFSDRLVEVPAWRGLALAAAIEESQPHRSTYLGRALEALAAVRDVTRTIVITDEQSHDAVAAPRGGAGYVINVSAEQHGVGYGPWVHIDGWSERVLDFIRATEDQAAGEDLTET